MNCACFLDLSQHVFLFYNFIPFLSFFLSFSLSLCIWSTLYLKSSFTLVWMCVCISPNVLHSILSIRNKICRYVCAHRFFRFVLKYTSTGVYLTLCCTLCDSFLDLIAWMGSLSLFHFNLFAKILTCLDFEKSRLKVCMAKNIFILAHESVCKSIQNMAQRSIQTPEVHCSNPCAIYKEYLLTKKTK